MAYSYPLPLADFMDVLPVQSITFDLPAAAEISKTQGGEILTAALGARLWQGTIKLDRMKLEEDDNASAMLDVARQAGASFLVTDKKKPWPRGDFGGTGLASATPTIASISADTRELGLAGLPPGYVIHRGDWLSFTYGSNPLRYALHRVASGAAADGAGVAGPMQVSPNIRAGAAVGAAVTLRKAVCKAIIVPGSVDMGTRASRLTTGVQFNWVQTLR